MATAKQIAWRKKFAAMSKAGTLRRKNPSRGGNDAIHIKKNMFKDLSIGQTFDWVDPNSRFNSFYDPCVKTSSRGYKSLISGLDMKVGSISAPVFHVDKYKINPSRGGNDAIHIDIDSHNTGGRNVRAKNPIKYHNVEIVDDGGFSFGVDEVTPVTFVFTTKDTKKAYRSFVLPREIVDNKEFQAWARGHNSSGGYVSSLRALRTTLPKLFGGK